MLQAHGVALGLAGTIVVACTATLAAIGAAAIPSAGLVTMLMVLQVVTPCILLQKQKHAQHLETRLHSGENRLPSQ